MRRRHLHRGISSLLSLFLAPVSKRSCLAFRVSGTGRPRRSRDGIGKRGAVGVDFSASVRGGDARSVRWNRKPHSRAPKATEGTTEATMGGGRLDLEGALRFARTNPNAVVLSLWPSAIGRDEQTPAQVEVSRSYLRRSGAQILYESSIEIPDSVSRLLVMAMYWGEDWLRTNCWYGEQPLEELGIGLARPTGPWPGASWKKELCFRQEASGGAETTDAPKTKRMHVLVADAGGGNRRLWSDKYAMRARMARDTGHAGNSCMHLTDNQSGIVTGGDDTAYGGGGGMDCNASYAFACARCLLNPKAMEFLVRCATKRFIGDDALRSDEFEKAFGKFCGWLGDRNFEDVASPSSDVTASKQWNTLPIVW